MEVEDCIQPLCKTLGIDLIELPKATSDGGNIIRQASPRLQHALAATSNMRARCSLRAARRFGTGTGTVQSVATGPPPYTDEKHAPVQVRFRITPISKQRA